jgi:hypothetical protein
MTENYQPRNAIGQKGTTADTSRQQRVKEKNNFFHLFSFPVEKAAERSQRSFCWPQALVRHTRGLCGHTTQNSTQPFPMENPETEDEFVWIDNRDFFTTLPAEVPPFFPIFRLNKFNKINKIATNSEKFRKIL